MVRTSVGLGGVQGEPPAPRAQQPHTEPPAPAGLVLVEEVAAQHEGVHLEAHRVLQDLLKRDERVAAAHRVLLVHTQVVVRRHQDAHHVRIRHGS